MSAKGVRQSTNSNGSDQTVESGEFFDTSYQSLAVPEVTTVPSLRFANHAPASSSPTATTGAGNTDSFASLANANGTFLHPTRLASLPSDNVARNVGADPAKVSSPGASSERRRMMIPSRAVPSNSIPLLRFSPTSDFATRNSSLPNTFQGAPSATLIASKNSDPAEYTRTLKNPSSRISATTEHHASLERRLRNTAFSDSFNLSTSGRRDDMGPSSSLSPSHATSSPYAVRKPTSPHSSLDDRHPFAQLVPPNLVTIDSPAQKPPRQRPTTFQSSPPSVSNRSSSEFFRHLDARPAPLQEREAPREAFTGRSTGRNIPVAATDVPWSAPFGNSRGSTSRPAENDIEFVDQTPIRTERASPKSSQTLRSSKTASDGNTNEENDPGTLRPPPSLATTRKNKNKNPTNVTGDSKYKNKTDHYKSKEKTTNGKKKPDLTSHVWVAGLSVLAAAAGVATIGMVKRKQSLMRQKRERQQEEEEEFEPSAFGVPPNNVRRADVVHNSVSVGAPPRTLTMTTTTTAAATTAPFRSHLYSDADTTTFPSSNAALDQSPAAASAGEYIPGRTVSAGLYALDPNSTDTFDDSASVQSSESSQSSRASQYSSSTISSDRALSQNPMRDSIASRLFSLDDDNPDALRLEYNRIRITQILHEKIIHSHIQYQQQLQRRWSADRPIVSLEELDVQSVEWVHPLDFDKLVPVELWGALVWTYKRPNEPDSLPVHLIVFASAAGQIVATILNVDILLDKLDDWYGEFILKPISPGQRGSDRIVKSDLTDAELASKVGSLLERTVYAM